MTFLRIASICFILITGNLYAAKKGGTFYYNLRQSPPSINPLSSTDAYSSTVKGYVLDTLLTRDLDTYEWKPGIAKAWNISKDNKTFIFTIREDAFWHDGKPVTVEDVKFSFDAIMHKDNKYKTAHLKPYFENFSKAVIFDGNKIKITANKIYFGNLESLANTFYIIPRHVYENPSKKEKKKLNKTLIGSGPYRLDKFKKGKKLILKRNKKWWGIKDSSFKDTYNFDKIHMRFINDRTISLTRMVKGDIDFQGLSPEEFIKKTKGSKWGKSVMKKQVENDSPSGYSFIGWNLLKPQFKSKKTRQALAHLINRNLMNEKFLFGLSDLATGPIYKKSKYCNQKTKAIPFDLKKSLKLLRADGWKDDAADKVLYKMIDGRKVSFTFTILEPNKEFMKYLTIFKEDAKKVGVDVRLKFVEWTTFIKLLDEKKFDAVRLAWGGGSVDMDPKQIWHSASAATGGSNFISYKNPKLDKLIDEARLIMDKKKRIPLMQKIHSIIADDAPYAFFFNSKYAFYGYSKKMKKEKDTYKYSVGLKHWWIEK